MSSTLLVSPDLSRRVRAVAVGSDDLDPQWFERMQLRLWNPKLFPGPIAWARFVKGRPTTALQKRAIKRFFLVGALVTVATAIGVGVLTDSVLWGLFTAFPGFFGITITLLLLWDLVGRTLRRSNRKQLRAAMSHHDIVAIPQDLLELWVTVAGRDKHKISVATARDEQMLLRERLAFVGPIQWWALSQREDVKPEDRNKLHTKIEKQFDRLAVKLTTQSSDEIIGQDALDTHVAAILDEPELPL